jgi:hexokinase
MSEIFPSILIPDHTDSITEDGLTRQCAWQLPSYVRSVSTGTERGKFLAVDLGGSNCRICLVNLHGDSTFTAIQTKHGVPADVMVNPSYEPLFSFIAEKISAFLEANSDSSGEGFHDRPGYGIHYRLGFTFSFTCEQTSLARGTLIRWDKGWDIPEAVGRDPCAMLQEAIDNLGLPVLVSVLANDSVGALLARAYTSGQKVSTLGAIIFGTGTNAAYVEKLSNIGRLGMATSAGGTMVINTEWGCFDDEMQVLPRTPFDDELDKNSINPGSQMFEKRVSGMYLGELLRLAILRLIETGALQLKVDEGSLVFRREGIGSSFLSRLADDKYDDLQKAAQFIMDTISAKTVTINEAQSIRLLAAAIARRAARLAGASLAAIIIQSGRLEVTCPSAKLDKTMVEEDQLGEPSTPFIGMFRRFASHFGLFLRKVLTSMRMSFVVAPHRSGALQGVTVDPIESGQEGDVIDIGADGSVIESFPTFEVYMRGAMSEVPEIGHAGEKRIQIGLIKDGSGIGAALMAQAATQTNPRESSRGRVE